MKWNGKRGNKKTLESNLVTQDELRNVARDEINEVDNYIYTT